jgi:hypothetical protein
MVGNLTVEAQALEQERDKWREEAIKQEQLNAGYAHEIDELRSHNDTLRALLLEVLNVDSSVPPLVHESEVTA